MSAPLHPAGLEQGRFPVRRIFYCEDSEALNKLPRKVVDAPFVEVFKVRLDAVLSNLVQQ